MGLGSLGISELVVIFVIVLVFFGPRRFPEIARSMGSAMREFRRSLNQIQRELEEVDPRKDIPGKELLDEIRTGKPSSWLDPNKPKSRPFDPPDSRTTSETPEPQRTGESAAPSSPAPPPPAPDSRTTSETPEPDDPLTSNSDKGEQLPMFDASESDDGESAAGDTEEAPTDDSRSG